MNTNRTLMTQIAMIFTDKIIIYYNHLRHLSDKVRTPYSIGAFYC